MKQELVHRSSTVDFSIVEVSYMPQFQWGRRAASGSGDQTVRTWDGTGPLGNVYVSTLEGLSSYVRFFISVSADGGVYCRDLGTRPRRSWTGPRETYCSAIARPSPKQ